MELRGVPTLALLAANRRIRFEVTRLLGKSGGFALFRKSPHVPELGLSFRPYRKSGVNQCAPRDLPKRGARKTRKSVRTHRSAAATRRGKVRTPDPLQPPGRNRCGPSDSLQLSSSYQCGVLRPAIAATLNRMREVRNRCLVAIVDLTKVVAKNCRSDCSLVIALSVGAMCRICSIRQSAIQAIL